MKHIAIILIAIFMVLLIFGFVVGTIVNVFFTPPQASYSDEVVEKIGGDDFLVATLKHCLKVSEENIPDASFKTSTGTYSWYDAKKITFVDTSGRKEYMVVWKSAPDKYPYDVSKKVNQYTSDYLTDRNAKCFIEYSWEDNCVYGIVLGTDNITCSESKLMYTILGLNKDGFDLSYTAPTTSSGSSLSSGNHYHTVVGDRYTLSRTDPGSYYDHYEYGDDYGIDDYLESEGYD